MGRVPRPKQTASAAGSLPANSPLSVHPFEDVLLVSTEAYVNTKPKDLTFSFLHTLKLISHLQYTDKHQNIKKK